MEVGKNVIREDARSKATGKAIYVADMKMPGMLVGKVLRSKVPYGKIISIDIEEALKISGVHTVALGKDVPGRNICEIVFDDMPLIAEEYVQYVGEPIALIAAENEKAAWQAMQAIMVNIEPLEPLTDPELYSSKDAPLLYGDDNVYAHHKIRRGNVDEAFVNAAKIIERTYHTAYQEHAYLETQGMLAVPTPQGGVDVYGSMQCPFYVHGVVADVCGLAQSRVRVVQATTGGAFGGKEDVPSLVAGWASVLAMLSERPVKVILDREEDMMSMSKRHPSRTRIKLAADKQGKITGAEIDVLFDGGAYSTLSSIVLWRGTVHAAGIYRIPNAKVDARAVATNKVHCGAYRGFGSPQTLFAIESIMDEMAKEFGIDPVDYRKMNLIKKGEETVTGQTIGDSFGLWECLEKSLEQSDYYHEKDRLNSPENPVKRGMGISTIFYGVGLGSGGTKLARTGAYVSIQQDASVQFAVGTTEMGQGMRTVLGQIVAESFGIPYELVSCLPVDTSRVPDSGPTVASRATTMSGRALVSACGALKRSLAKAAAEKWGVKSKDINVADGRATLASEPNKWLNWDELVAEAHAQKKDVAVVMHDSSPPTSWEEESGQGDAYVVYAYATNIAQVAVDTRTGVVTLEKLWAAHDVGKAINPQLVEGQIEGGSLQGAGYALMEEYMIDNAGIPINPRFAFYHIPSVDDSPEMHPIIVESAYKDGPFGAKGFAEQPLMGIAPAVANAIYNATGKRLRTQPFTPERMRAALRGDNDVC